MKVKCTNKRCGYEGQLSESSNPLLICPCCSHRLLEIGIEDSLNKIEKNMLDCLRWYGKEFVFSEIDALGNPLLRCHHRKIFFGLLKKVHWEWETV